MVYPLFILLYPACSSLAISPFAANCSTACHKATYSSESIAIRTRQATEHQNKPLQFQLHSRYLKFLFHPELYRYSNRLGARWQGILVSILKKTKIFLTFTPSVLKNQPAIKWTTFSQGAQQLRSEANHSHLQ
jgi:hypothetical protein